MCISFYLCKLLQPADGNEFAIMMLITDWREDIWFPPPSCFVFVPYPKRCLHLVPGEEIEKKRLQNIKYVHLLAWPLSLWIDMMHVVSVLVLLSVTSVLRLFQAGICCHLPLNPPCFPNRLISSSGPEQKLVHRSLWK